LPGVIWISHAVTDWPRRLTMDRDPIGRVDGGVMEIDPQRRHS
jgi:hypothetical protein